MEEGSEAGHLDAIESRLPEEIPNPEQPTGADRRVSVRP